MKFATTEGYLWLMRPLTCLLIALCLCAAFPFVSMAQFGAPMMITGPSAPPASVPPSSIICDIGPPYTGAIPAAATQAGFTHCAMNFDFTYTGSFTDALGTHQWCAGSLPCSIANMSSWFTCTPLTTSPPYLFFFYSTVACDSTHITITTDSGVQALAMSYYQTDANAGHYDNVLEGQGNINGGTTDPLPSEYYTELTYRLSAAQTSGSFYILFDTSSLTDVSGSTCYVASDQEWDSYPTANGVGYAVYDSSCPQTGATANNNPINASVRTVGKLVTADGINKFAFCNYTAAGPVKGLDKTTFGSCTSITVDPRASFATHLYEYMEEGPYHNSVGANWDIPSHTTYVFRKTFWTCSGYTGGSCITNPVITTAPP